MVTAAALSWLSASLPLFPLFIFFAEAEGPWVALAPSPLCLKMLFRLHLLEALGWVQAKAIEANMIPFLWPV